MPQDFDTEGAVWQSACRGIATVDALGSVTGVKCGRTELTVTAADGKEQTILVTVEFLTSTNNGYTFPTQKDEITYDVTSEYEADRLLDRAIAAHTSEITVDFSALGSGYCAAEDYSAVLELSSHVSITKKWYEDSPNVILFEINYDTDTASEFTPTTEDNTYFSLANANMIIRNAARTEGKRADDFEDFPINLESSGTMDVYNSEELWWALENNLKPNFPLNNSKAELFYERAKMLLRDIITDDMTDYEKVLAIFDALTDIVAYDYDAAAAPEEEGFHTDVCYYLEGVFERGLAVCDGKSKAFVLLCGIEGIGAVRDFGDARDGGAGHAWNYVEIDGAWYLVDTTAADAAYSKYTSFGEYIGRSVEITVYDTLLVSMNSLYDEYEYSGIWDDLVYGNDESLVFGYLLDTVNDGGDDFYIDSKEELSSLISTLVYADLCDECVLTFAISSDAYYRNLPFDAADAVLPADADYAVFTLPIAGVLNYLMFITGI